MWQNFMRNNVYASTLKKIPRPKCICFYNGTDEQPEKKVFRLSEAYDGEGDVEVTVTMLNINYSRNKKLMDSCKPLYEYSWIVNEIRQNRGDNLEETIDKVINSIPEDFVIRSFIMGHRAEVKGMFLTEWNQEKVLQQEREDSLEQGREQGIAEGITRMVAGMLKKNLPRPMIAEISNLPDEVIANIASQL